METEVVDCIKLFSDLQRRLFYKDDVYVLIIFKHEHDGHSNAYWCFYAKETSLGFSTRKVLFAASGSSLLKVINKFVQRYKDCCANNYIKGVEWVGTDPFAIDFNDPKFLS